MASLPGGGLPGQMLPGGPSGPSGPVVPPVYRDQIVWSDYLAITLTNLLNSIVIGSSDVLSLSDALSIDDSFFQLNVDLSDSFLLSDLAGILPSSSASINYLRRYLNDVRR